MEKKFTETNTLSDKPRALTDKRTPKRGEEKDIYKNKSIACRRKVVAPHGNILLTKSFDKEKKRGGGFATGSKGEREGLSGGVGGLFLWARAGTYAQKVQGKETGQPNA